jgi:hypothetical protein
MTNEVLISPRERMTFRDHGLSGLLSEQSERFQTGWSDNVLYSVPPASISDVSMVRDVGCSDADSCES